MLAMVWVRWLHTCLHNIATNSHLQKIIANIHAYIIQPKTSGGHEDKEISLFSGQNFGLTRLGGRQTDGTKQRCSVGWLPADTESDRAEVPPRNPLLLTTIFYVFFNGSDRECRQTDGTKQRCSVGWLPADTESDRAEVPPRNPLLLTTIFYVFFNG